MSEENGTGPEAVSDVRAEAVSDVRADLRSGNEFTELQTEIYVEAETEPCGHDAHEDALPCRGAERREPVH